VRGRRTEDCRNTIDCVPSALDLFGKRVKELRIERRISQEALAAMCAVHRNFIGRVERGETNIKFDRIVKIAGGLHVRPEVLFALVPRPKAPEPHDTE
jgi:transcriptional regulator with XRE-family HTH domain